MKLITKTPINFKDNNLQQTRFADGQYKTKTINLVKNLKDRTDASYGVSEIHVDITSLIFPRFEAEIKYIQNWTENIQVPILDENLQPTNETETKPQPHSVVFLSYDLRLSYNEIKPLLDYFDTLVDAELQGVERLKHTIMLAIKADVISHKTFITDDKPNGLQAEDYTQIIL